MLNSLMIYNVKLHLVIKNNEIKILSLCYLMPPSHDSIVCVSEVSQVQSLMQLVHVLV